MAEKVGTFDTLAISAGESDASYTNLEFITGSTLGVQQDLYDPQGMRGHRGTIDERVREVRRQAAGTLVFQPGPADLDILLPWITGSTKNGNNFVPAANVPFRYLRASRNGTWFTYGGMKVALATFQASENSPLTVTLQLVGQDETSGSDPTASAASTEVPFIFSDAVLSIGGSSYAFRSLNLTYDNMLDPRFNNSVTLSSITAADLAVSVDLSLPYGDTTALYGASAAAGVAASITFTNGTTQFAVSMPKVRAPKTPLPFGERGRVVDQPWNGIARKTGSSDIITFSNDLDTTS